MGTAVRLWHAWKYLASACHITYASLLPPFFFFIIKVKESYRCIFSMLPPNTETLALLQENKQTPWVIWVLQHTTASSWRFICSLDYQSSDKFYSKDSYLASFKRAHSQIFCLSFLTSEEPVTWYRQPENNWTRWFLNFLAIVCPEEQVTWCEIRICRIWNIESDGIRFRSQLCLAAAV